MLLKLHDFEDYCVLVDKRFMMGEKDGAVHGWEYGTAGFAGKGIEYFGQQVATFYFVAGAFERIEYAGLCRKYGA